MPLTLRDAYPLTASTKPGERATLVLEVELDGSAADAVLTARLRDAGTVALEATARHRIEPGANELHVAIDVPLGSARGYEVLLELRTDAEALEGRTALLVIDHWRQAPRYGFVSEFGPEEPGVERVGALSRFHLTVVQFYDWMYRHYRFVPPEDEFVDAMGRRLSLRTVRQRVTTCHEHGMAALAYGAVYGPEPEFVHEHPEWVLNDANGNALSLIDRFYITDLRAGAPWREHILREFEACVEELAFDGIHMDQYGFPKWSYGASGESVDLAASFPGMIDEAARRVAALRDGASVLFNAVNGWPLAAVASSAAAAVYVEVWPPHDRYQDLVDLIRRARDLAGTQAILAAYLEPFREGGPGAEVSALLATAVIASAGGFHLLLGEGDAVLRDPYYPNHGRLEAAFVPTMRRYYDHTAAFHAYLFDETYVEVTTSFTTGINGEIALVGASVSSRPEVDSVWISIRQAGNRFVVNLVNLVGAGDDRWNAHKARPAPLPALSLCVSSFARVERVAWASPDVAVPARELAVETDASGGTVVRLPTLDVWATVIIELG